MVMLTTTQRNTLQADIAAGNTAGFYAHLDSYGDPYGRFDSGVKE